MDDLLIITPNGRLTAFLEELLRRHLHLGIGEIRFVSLTLSLGSEALLQNFGAPIAEFYRQRCQKCLVIIDEDRTSDDELSGLIDDLTASWGKDVAVIVAKPAVESWMLEGHRAFSRIPQLRGVDVRRWFAETGVWPLGTDVPDQPRHALEALFSAFRIEPSNAHYRLIGRHFPIRIDQLQSTSLRHLFAQLNAWFAG